MAKKIPARAVAQASSDERYFEIVANAVRVCANYRPKFGKGGRVGLTLEEFQTLYRADPFYNWVGLDSHLMYAAHKAAGGMTSIYGQLGRGCEALFHRILQDQLGLSAEQAAWQYTVPVLGKTPRTLTLDGRITLSDITDAGVKSRVEHWLQASHDKVLLAPEVRPTIRGAVFEVRQGYKSKDAKRQNADISNAANAYANLYLPVLLVVSTQIDNDVATRYAQAQWLLLTGTQAGLATESTYSFCREVLSYDLAAFFQRNATRFKKEIEAVLKTLLGA